MTKLFRFGDMHSGGFLKTPHENIYIYAANKAEAIAKFQAKFDYDPTGTTCNCCGPDFWIWESEDGESLEETTEFYRSSNWQPPDYEVAGEVLSLKEYFQSGQAVLIC